MQYIYAKTKKKEQIIKEIDLLNNEMINLL